MEKIPRSKIQKILNLGRTNRQAFIVPYRHWHSKGVLGEPSVFVYVSPLRPSFINALEYALCCDNRIVDRSLISRRARLGWYLRKFPCCQNRGGDEQHTLTALVHSDMIYLSPYVRPTARAPLLLRHRTDHCKHHPATLDHSDWILFLTSRT
jgi:hypothetical protein